jgi:hypothetical protein
VLAVKMQLLDRLLITPSIAGHNGGPPDEEIEEERG